MECNECSKETDSIMVICPECDGKKDEQIAALQAQLADREERLAAWKNHALSWEHGSFYDRIESDKKLHTLGER